MPNPNVIAVPYRGLVRLVGADRGIAVEHVEHGIGAVRYGRNLDPESHRTAGGTVVFPFIGQRTGAPGIRREENVVAVRVGYIAAISRGRQVCICPRNEYREI